MYIYLHIQNTEVLVECWDFPQSLHSSYFLVFYHFGFETTTLTFSRIIDFNEATNLFFKQVYACTVVDSCLI
jgi:hypothetical protein